MFSEVWSCWLAKVTNVRLTRFWGWEWVGLGWGGWVMRWRCRRYLKTILNVNKWKIDPSAYQFLTQRISPMYLSAIFWIFVKCSWKLTFKKKYWQLTRGHSFTRWVKMNPIFVSHGQYIMYMSRWAWLNSCCLCSYPSFICNQFSRLLDGHNNYRCSSLRYNHDNKVNEQVIIDMQNYSCYCLLDQTLCHHLSLISKYVCCWIIWNVYPYRIWALNFYIVHT